MRFVCATDVHEQQALEQQLQSEDEDVRLQALRVLLPQQHARAQGCVAGQPGAVRLFFGAAQRCFVVACVDACIT